jgi:hypothetical protein
VHGRDQHRDREKGAGAVNAKALYGPQAILGQVHVLGSFSVQVPEAAAKENWDRRLFYKRRKEGGQA